MPNSIFGHGFKVPGLHLSLRWVSTSHWTLEKTVQATLHLHYIPVSFWIYLYLPWLFPLILVVLWFPNFPLRDVFRGSEVQPTHQSLHAPAAITSAVLGLATLLVQRGSWGQGLQPQLNCSYSWKPVAANGKPSCSFKSSSRV